ncbi:MAG: carboxypeptidase-like regulatory domain-containing protein [Pyrinomonadaceae bacterium]
MNQKLDINKLRVASPCSVGWETMTGNELVRHCDSCKLNVYSTDAITKRDLEDLIFRTEGRTCLRLHRRADGTVLTKDCPVGLRGYQKRAARFAGATLTAILGFFSVSYGQEGTAEKSGASKVDIVKTVTQDTQSSIFGTVKDPQGAVIPGAQISLLIMRIETNVIKSKTNGEGRFSFKNLPRGFYDIEVSLEGFKKMIVAEIEIKKSENITIDIGLEVGETTVGIVAIDESTFIKPPSTSITTTITIRKP